MAQGIVGSQHDLSTDGGGQNVGNAATDQVCVYCHTPHGADISEEAVPLWNRALPSTTYTRYSNTGTPTFDSAEASVGSVSLACLSCHDGTQAMDSVINAPGSGGHNPAGSVITGSTIGSMSGSPVPNLTADLSDDHPISIPYGAGGCDNTDADGQCAATNLTDPDFYGPFKGTVNTQAVWWVDTSEGAAATRDKTDLPLYVRTDGAVSGGEPFVECGSCHDPHNSASGVAADSVAFLRTSDNADSKICVACHNK